MARIRTIKPEFPHSETIGRLSRDARLLFVLLWTIADDSGRARAASRMLASLLFPYDDDAPALIEGWLVELDRADCIRRYVVEGSQYLEICNWLKHQKIDKPTVSRLPEFDEASRIVASPREASATDLGPGPRTLDQEEDQAAAVVAADETIMQAIGVADNPNWYGHRARIIEWTAAWDVELDILPTINRLMAMRTGPPRSPKFFEEAIAEHHARRLTPLPKVVVNNTPEIVHVQANQHHPGGEWGARRDAFAAAHAELKATLAASGEGGAGG